MLKNGRTETTWAQRLIDALGGWLTPAYTGTLCLDIDLVRLPALSVETDTLWARLNAATFLTTDEKRTATGYGPLPLDQKFNPGQPRVPSGKPNGGRWTRNPDGGGGGSGDGGGGSNDGGPTLDPFDDGVWDISPDALDGAASAASAYQSRALRSSARTHS